MAQDIREHDAERTAIEIYSRRLSSDMFVRTKRTVLNTMKLKWPSFARSSRIRFSVVIAIVFAGFFFGCETTPVVDLALQKERNMLASEMRASLQEDVLDVWYPRSIDSVFGGFIGEFPSDWKPTENGDKMIVTQARHVWTTSRASQIDRSNRQMNLDAAAQGVVFLRDHFWDAKYGGFYSLVERDGTFKSGEDGLTHGKTAYGNAFAIYGLATYFQASQDSAALDLARNAFLWLDESAHDAVHGGYFQFIERSGKPIEDGWDGFPPKDQNSSIHLLEAFTELYQVWPDERVARRLEEMLTLIRDTMISDVGYLRLYFEKDWTPVSFHDSTEAVRSDNAELDHVSFGHDIETAYLMLEAGEALGLDISSTLTVSKRMVDHAIRWAWDRNKGGFFDRGFYFGDDTYPTIILHTKTWWVQAEALNTLLLMGDYFPEDSNHYYDLFKRMWTYIQGYLIDSDNGGWYWGGLDREPERRIYLKGSIWKGAYHDGRAYMNVINRLERT